MSHSNSSHIAPTFPLAMASPGESVRISSIRQGQNIQMRMLSMGIKIDDVVTVLHSHGHGNVLIAKGDSRYTMGGGMALKIQVVKEN